MAQAHSGQVSRFLRLDQGLGYESLDLLIGPVTIQVKLNQSKVGVERLVRVEPGSAQLVPKQLVFDSLLPVAQRMTGQGLRFVGVGFLGDVLAGEGGLQGLLGGFQGVAVAGAMPV